MRQIRLLLPLLAISLALVSTLLRPLPSRAARAPKPTGPSRTGTVGSLEPRRALPGLAARRSRRKLAGIRHVSHTFPFGVQVVRFAKHLLGVPYHYGGNSPGTGFDCSGFVRYVYSHFGVSLPHSSFGDLVRGRGVGRWALHPGDLVFFDDAGHVGIYVGNGRFIHAPHTGTVVRISTMSWYGARYDGARRLR